MDEPREIAAEHVATEIIDGTASQAGKGWRRVAIDTRPLRHPAYRRMFIG